MKAELTRRELEILRHLSNGLTNSQIAGKLNLSIFTIETHRKKINLKLGAHSTATMLKAAWRNGLL